VGGFFRTGFSEAKNNLEEKKRKEKRKSKQKMAPFQGKRRRVSDIFTEMTKK